MMSSRSRSGRSSSSRPRSPSPPGAVETWYPCSFRIHVSVRTSDASSSATRIREPSASDILGSVLEKLGVYVATAHHEHGGTGRLHQSRTDRRRRGGSGRLDGKSALAM